MEKIHSDITVAGGGIAGICAALAAVRNGLRVSLVNNRPVLGGNASSEIDVNINGAAYNGNSPSVYAREGGIIEEIKRTAQYYGGLKDAAYFDLIYAEPNISLFLNTQIHGVLAPNGRIASISGIQQGSEREFSFESPLFIDCTGDGTVAFRAGVPYMLGRESRARFGESLAPTEADGFVLGDTLTFRSVYRDRPVTFRRPAFAYDIKKLPFFKNIGKKGLHRDIYRAADGTVNCLWWLEYGGHLDTVGDNEEITLELRKLTLGFWDYIKNSGDFEETENLELSFIATIPGKRESRRFIGDYILTQNDIERKTDFPDAVATGGWPMDIHAPRGIYDDAPATEWNYVPGTYNIPFRCLYSRAAENLLFAGRNISASHAAFSSTRVMATGGALGQAAGTAAYLCAKYGITPAEVAASRIDELQSLLQRGDQAIMGLHEDVGVAADAVVTASSEREYEVAEQTGLLRLDGEYTLALPVTRELDSIEIGIKSEGETSLSVELWGGGRPENNLPAHILRSVTLSVAANADGWAALPLSVEKPGDGKVYLIFKPNPLISLYTSDEALTGIVSFRRDEKSREDTEFPEFRRLPFNICFRGVLPEQRLFAPENVTNGWSRPYGAPNLWMSGKSAAGQWLKLDFKKRVNISELQVILNTKLEEDNIREDIPVLIKDYKIEVTAANGGSRTIEVRNNFLRLNRHLINTPGVTSVKITVKDTYGGNYAEIYAVKAWE
jgi:hypothetical protein